VGTSTSYSGSRTGLVPSWVDDPTPGVAFEVVPAALGPSAAPNPAAPLAAVRMLSLPDISGAGGLGGARGSFSRFFRTGSGRALGGALSNYIRNGTGGARRAAQRMGASRAVGGRLLGVLRDVGQLGAVETLRRLNLPGLVGRSATDVFLALLEFVSPPGGAVDEAIARQAMLEAIGDLAEAGLGNFDDLSPDQLREFFLGFVGRSIEGRIMADLGQRAITLPDDIEAVERAQQQLHEFIAGCTRGQLARRLDGLDRLSDRDVDRTVNEIYEAAFALIAAVAAEATA
jgi:hypothetical protein